LNRRGYAVAVHYQAIICLAGGLALAGCVTQENDRTTIGRSVRLEAFEPPAPPAPGGESPVLTEQGRSLAGLERSNWQPTMFLVPVDGVAHRPIYTRHLYLTDSSARQRREYPNPTSALELTEGSEESQQLEAVANDLLAIADTVMLIPRLVLEPPWRTEYSPKIGHRRYWGPQRTDAIVQAEALPPTPSAETAPAGPEGIQVQPTPTR
jgi:hypothetical protein